MVIKDYSVCVRGTKVSIFKLVICHAFVIDSSSYLYILNLQSIYIKTKKIIGGYTHMNMTHYMGLLADNQPWNLIIFMAIPVICAETIAVTELAILFTRNLTGKLRLVNKVTSIFVGIYFTGIFIYLLFNAVIPITSKGEWHGWIDVVAVGFYLLGIIPLLGMALLDLSIIYKNKSQEKKLKVHAIFVGMFLIFAHIAMIAGMVDPTIISDMPTMGHDM
jgi:hypothetical protein